MTLPIVAGMNLLLEDQVTSHYLLTGLVASIAVASVISGLIIYFLAILAQIQQDNKHLTGIINACPIPMALNDDARNILLLNPEFTKAFGYTRDDIPSLQHWWPKAYPDADYRQWVADTWQSHLHAIQSNSGTFDPLEVKICCKNGETKTVIATATPLESSYRGLHLVVLYDITEKARASDALRKSYTILQSIVETIPMRVFWKDLDSRYVGCNTLFAKDGGKTLPAEVIGRLDDELTWRDQASLYRADDQQVMQSGLSKLAYEEPQTTPEGKTIWLRTSKAPLRDDQANVIGVLGIYDDITERKKFEHELWLAKTMLDKSETAFFTLNAAGKIQYVNDHACLSLGYSREALLNMYPWYFDPDFPQTAWPALWQSLKDDKFVNFESRHRHKDGHVFNVNITGHYIVYNGEALSFTIAQDITERKQSETQLRIAATAFEAQEGMVITDAETTILNINQSFTELTGYGRKDLVGHKMNILKSGVHDDAFYDEMWATIAKTDYWQGEIWNRRKNGDLYLEWLTITAVKDQAGVVTHYVGTMLDITARKEREEAVKHLAHFDILTDLPNRILLTDRLQQALAQVRREKAKLALMFLDLDKFKPVNDNLGHGIGDLLLREVAKRLQSCIKRETDTVARLGGDEFVILLSHIDHAQDAALVAEKVVRALNQPFDIEHHTIQISTSLGIAIYPTHGAYANELLKKADDAMYQAKESGRSCFKFFDQRDIPIAPYNGQQAE